MSSSQTVDIGVAALAKVVGAAQYEAGVSADVLNTNTGVASSKFSSGNPVQRMIWGVRAMVGDILGKQDLKRDEITFRMMDLKLFKAVEKELKHLERCFDGDTFRADRRDTQAAQGIYDQIKHRVESSSLNSAEQKVLLKYVHTILNLDNKNREEYNRAVRDTYNSSTDTQYEKVREDAKHRWRGFASNVIVSSVAKFSSVVLSPLATPIVGIAGVAAVETFVQGLLKSRMEECSLKTKTSQLSRAINKQIEGFYSVDSDTPITERAVPTDPLGRPPMVRLAEAVAALDNMSSLTEKEKAERFNEASDVARFVLENARNLEELLSGPRGEAKLSIVTAERLKVLRKELEENITRLRAHGVTTGGDASDPSRFYSDAISGLKLKDEHGATHARADLNEEYKEIYSFVNELRGTEAAAISSFSESKLREIRANAFSIGNVAKRFALNTISSTLAVFGAGARAVANSEAFVGEHAIAVKDNVMELGEYLDKKSGEAFASATGLDKLGPAGKAIADSCGGCIQDFVRFYFDRVNGAGAWGHMFNATTHTDGSVVYDTVDPSVYEIITLEEQKHFNTHGIKRHLSIDRLIELCENKNSPVYQELLNIKEAKFSHGRYFDFTREGFRPTLHAAVEFVGWTAANIANVAAGAVVLLGAKTKNETDLKYQHPLGFRPPLFGSQLKSGQGSSVPPTSPPEVTVVDPGGSTTSEKRRPDRKAPDTIDVDWEPIDPKTPKGPIGALPERKPGGLDRKIDQPEVPDQRKKKDFDHPEIIDVDWEPIDPKTRPTPGALPTGRELKIGGGSVKPIGSAELKIDLPGLPGQRKKDDDLLGDAVSPQLKGRSDSKDIAADSDEQIPTERVLITPPPKEVAQEAVVPTGVILRHGLPGFSRLERESKALELSDWESDLLRERNKHGKAVTERAKGISDAIPTVFIDSQVLGEMKHLTHRNEKNKVAWIAAVERTGDGFVVRDLSIPHQGAEEIHSNIYRDEEFRKKTQSKGRNHSFLIGTAFPGDKAEIAPSYQDDVEALRNLEGKDFFLRLYTNKRGDLAIDVFDKSKNRIYTNVNWKTIENEKGERPRFQELDEAYKRNVKTGVDRQIEEMASVAKPEEKKSGIAQGDTGMSVGQTMAPGAVQKEKTQEVKQQQIQPPIQSLGM